MRKFLLVFHRVGQIKLASAVYFIVVKHVLENFDNFWQVK